jgi:hypothetical protein
MSDNVAGTNPFNHLLEAERQQSTERTSNNDTTKTNEKLRKNVRKQVRKHVNPFDQSTVNREDIEMMWFRLRNTDKKRVTADIPEEWRDELYQMALDLKIGRYEFVGYILASFLGKTRTED